MNYEEILKKVETTTSAVTDDALRKIAFDRLLEHELKALSSRKHDLSVKGGASTQDPVKRPRRSNGGHRSGVRPEVGSLKITPDEAGLPPWDTLGAVDKYLWILLAAHKKGLDGLTGPEISHVIYEVFKESRPTDEVKNLKIRIKSGFVHQAKDGEESPKVWRILRKGIQHLETLSSTAKAAQ